MNVEFGAKLFAISSIQSTKAIDSDRVEHEFAIEGSSDHTIAKLIAAAFNRCQSKNARILSRRSTNKGYRANLRHFLSWAAKQGEHELSSAMLLAYRTEIYSQGAAASAHGRYAVVAMFIADVMKHGDIKPFLIPRNISNDSVTPSKGQAGNTMATALTETPHPAGADDFNEMALRSWTQAAWHEVNSLFERIRQGSEWRSEADLGDDRPLLSPRERIALLDRGQVLALAKSICVEHLDGKLPDRFSARLRSRPSDNLDWSRTLQAFLWEANRSLVEHVDKVSLAEALADGSTIPIPLPDWLQWSGLCERETSEERAKRLVKLMHRRFGGFPLDQNWGEAEPPSRDEECVLIHRLIHRSHESGCAVTVLDLVSYFHPTPALVGLTISLLAAAHVNPSSSAQLEIDCLVADEQPGIQRLLWRKGRAGGEQPSLPFPAGSEKARTVPRLIQRFMAASGELRSMAPDELATGLFLWTRGCGLKFMDDHHRTVTVWNNARKYMSGFQTGMKPSSGAIAALGPLASHLKSITPSLLRKTAIDVSSARLNRDFEASARLDGRKSVEALERSYLSNAQTREHLDSQVRLGQTAFASWLAGGPVVLPPDKAVIARRLAVDQDTAERIATDQLNLGTGASLVDNRAIFIDSPINALRVMQWLAHLEEARDRVARDNPARWSALFEPQAALFNEALQAMSRPSKAAARKMNSEFQLPFPPIH